MFKKITALFLVLLAFSACTKQATTNETMDITSTNMGINNDIPMIDGDAATLSDPVAVSLLALFNSQDPVARLPEENDGILIFTASNGDSFRVRRSTLYVEANAEPFLAAGANPEKFAMGNGILYTPQFSPVISFSRTAARTMDLSFSNAEGVVHRLFRTAPELLSSNGFDFTLGDEFVRLNWNANTQEWSFGINATILTDTGLDVSLLKGYELKDGFLMNTMKPL